MQRIHIRSLSRGDKPIDELIRSMEMLNKRLKAGLVDTTTPAFYAVMASIIRLQLNRLCDQLDRQRIDIHSGKFQDFLVSLAKIEMLGKRKRTAKLKHP